MLFLIFSQGHKWHAYRTAVLKETLLVETKSRFMEAFAYWIIAPEIKMEPPPQSV